MTDDATGERQHETLAGERPQKLPARGAERGPQRDLARPRRRARQLEIRQIGAGDQQHESRQPEREPRHAARGPIGRRSVQRQHAQPMVFVVPRLVAGDPLRHGIQRRPGLLQ
ncbi:MAG: hypothetical protein KBG39_10690 [Opitutaceae bacterium]|nr:hypothetical protein [Opitutaceae bacterium]